MLSEEESTRPDGCKQIHTSLSCQTATEKISRIHSSIHMVFRWENFYCCSTNEPPEWSLLCGIGNAQETRACRTSPKYPFQLLAVCNGICGCIESWEYGIGVCGARCKGGWCIYYRNVLLTQHLLPAINWMSDGHFIFQQDSAPAHRAQETIALLCRETPDFILPWLWFGHPTALIWIRWIIMCGAYWSSRCITNAFTMSITSRHVWLKNGRSVTRRSSSGVHVWGHAFNKEEDILSIGCKTVDRLFVKWSCCFVVNSIFSDVL